MGTELEPNAGPRRYHLVRRIGSGAFGDVYLAELESGGFRRRVALKVLNDASANRRSARQRIRDEARILGRLAHRNIVAALDFVRVGKGYALVMDYVQGADLDHVLAALEVEREPMPMRAAFELAAAVAEALHAAFTAPEDDGRPLGIVHRDIKPSNLRLTADGEVKVLDFGIALAPSRREAAGKPIVGTELYMAPERFEGAAEDPSIDVFSLGITLLEMLTGHTLGPPSTDRAAHAERVSVAVESVRRYLEGGPPELVSEILATLSACLAFEPRLRPPAEALAQRFESYAEHIPGESLRAFCRRFVPLVSDQVGAQFEPVSGVWTEEVGTGLSMLHGGTLLPGDPSTSPSEHAAPARRVVAWSSIVGLLAVLAACAAAGAGFGVVLQALRQSPAPAVPLPAAPIAAPAPVVASVPTAEPTGTAPTTRKSAQPQVLPRVVTPDAARVDRAQFSVRDASRIEVVCGDRSAVGTSSLRLTGFPAGPCVLTAEYVGGTFTSELTVVRVGQVRCEVVAERLSCSTP